MTSPRKYRFKRRFDKQFKRIIKTPREIKLIKKSARITDSCIKIIERELKRKDVTEKQLALAIERNIRNQNAKLAFPTIVACGRRAAYIHAKPTDKIIRGLGYADFGAKYKGYCTDITVPFVKGKISEDGQKLLETALLAYEKMVKSVKLGGKCWKVHDSYERFLHKYGYKPRHLVGHGIGLDVHELPSIGKPRRGRKLNARKKKLWGRIRRLRFEPGMAFTIEPGIYAKGIGGCRIENDVLLTKNGAKALTHAKPIKLK